MHINWREEGYLQAIISILYGVGLGLWAGILYKTLTGY